MTCAFPSLPRRAPRAPARSTERTTSSLHARRLTLWSRRTHAEYVGNCYGTPKSYVERRCAEGVHVLLDIDVQGVHQISEKRPDAIRVFMMPPSFAELERRLRGRHTDDEQKICERLAQARRECALAYTYDYVVINDDPDVAAKELDAIITAECCRYPDRKNYFTEVLEK